MSGGCTLFLMSTITHLYTYRCQTWKKYWLNLKTIGLLAASPVSDVDGGHTVKLLLASVLLEATCSLFLSNKCHPIQSQRWLYFVVFPLSAKIMYSPQHRWSYTIISHVHSVLWIFKNPSLVLSTNIPAANCA